MKGTGARVFWEREFGGWLRVIVDGDVGGASPRVAVDAPFVHEPGPVRVKAAGTIQAYGLSGSDLPEAIAV